MIIRNTTGSYLRGQTCNRPPMWHQKVALLVLYRELKILCSLRMKAKAKNDHKIQIPLHPKPLSLTLPFHCYISTTFNLKVTVECNTFFPPTKPGEVIPVTFNVYSLYSPAFVCSDWAIFQYQTDQCTLSLHGAGRDKCQPFVCVQMDPFLWQTALDDTWLFNFGNAAATCEWTALWRLDTQTAAWCHCCHLFEFDSNMF